VSFWTLAISGVAIGFLKSTMGVGGGFVLLPALVYLVKLPLPVAAGTSLFTVLLSGFSGAVAYIVSNNIDWAGVFYMTVTSLAGAVLGTAATVKVDNDKIKIFFAVTLFLGGVSVLLKELRFDLLSNTFIFGVAGISTLLIIYAFFIGGFLRKNYKSMDSV
jgi:uncharacterized membrane protein YfcA